MVFSSSTFVSINTNQVNAPSCCLVFGEVCVAKVKSLEGTSLAVFKVVSEEQRREGSSVKGEKGSLGVERRTVVQVPESSEDPPARGGL